VNSLPTSLPNIPTLILVDKTYQLKDNIDNQNSLSNIAPTILDIMGLEKPDEMTAESLLIKQSSFV
jgi:2,3-bisphosphoglycerate-independent phosphoglycerate mutase